MSKYIKERYTGTMPYKFIFNIDHDIYFEAMLESERCVAHNLNGQRCSRNVCIGINLCWSHLLKYKHLKIKTSTIPNAGKGLFAEDKSLAPDAVVFSEGDLIADYIGERIDRDTLIQRYAKHTAPYAFYLKNNVYIDSALERGFASLANAAPTQRQKFFKLKAYRSFILMGDDLQICLQITKKYKMSQLLILKVLLEVINLLCLI